MSTPTHLPQNKILNDVYDRENKVLKVDMGTAVSLNASDIQIGAVELKDSLTDNRLLINEDGSLNVNGTFSGGDGIDDKDISQYTYLDSFTSIDETHTYIKKQNTNGTYLFLRIDNLNDKILYATKINNPTYTEIEMAWNNKEILIYENIGGIL